MTIELDHAIVPARDRNAAAERLATLVAVADAMTAQAKRGKMPPGIRLPHDVPT